MSRHIYTLVVDCPEHDAQTAADIADLGARLHADYSGRTRTITLGTIVPHGDGVGLRPRVVMEEVRTAKGMPDGL